MNRIYKKILVIAFVFFASSTIVNAQLPQVIINETSQGDNAGGSVREWVELVVLQDNTDLRGVYLDADYQLGGLGTYRRVQFNWLNDGSGYNPFTSVPKGTIIVIYNWADTNKTVLPYNDTTFGTANHTPYNPTGTDDWTLCAASNNANYFVNTGSATPGGNDKWPLSKGSSDMIGLFIGNSSSSYAPYSPPKGIFGLEWGNPISNNLPTSTALNTIFDTGGGSLGYVAINNISLTSDMGLTLTTDSYLTAGDWTSETTNTQSTPEALQSGQTLPVELSSFSAVIEKSSVNLIWKTQTEVNNYGFLVERSGKNEDWHSLGFVDGNGNSNSPKNYSFEDNTVNASGTYSYRLKQVDNDGTYEYSKAIEVSLGTPVNTELKQNYPNPFNPSTTINFTLTADNQVSLIVYNAIGEQVKVLYSGMLEAGVHSFNFNGDELPSGLYIYKLSTSSGSQVRKMMLVK